VQVRVLTRSANKSTTKATFRIGK